MNMYMYMLFLLLILILIMILISVAFLTLMERKILGYIQMRKGPNKVGIGGILQPFSDAIKLLSKELLIMNKSNYYIFLIVPMLGFLLLMMMWLIYPMIYNYMMFNFSFLYLICCLSLSVYTLLMSGWSSNSSYSMLGSIRALAQSISFEVSLVIIMLVPMFMINSMNLNKFLNFQIDIWLIIFLWPLSFIFLFSLMAELNRTPFDFSEGESELVSGFNIEYMSSGFTLIFLTEYASILFLSLLFVLMFLGSDFFNFMFYLKLMFMTFLVIWLRGTLPRFRYDLLMYLCWLLILPFSLNYMIYMIYFKILIFK